MEEYDATCVVPPGAKAELDAKKNPTARNQRKAGDNDAALATYAQLAKVTGPLQPSLNRHQPCRAASSSKVWANLPWS